MSKKAKAKSTKSNIVVTGKGKRVTFTNRTAARRYVKGQYNAAVREKKVSGKRASCMMKVPENFRSQFKIDGVVAGAA